MSCCVYTFLYGFCTEKGPKQHITFDLQEGKPLREQLRPVLGPFLVRKWTPFGAKVTHYRVYLPYLGSLLDTHRSSAASDAVNMM